MEIFLLFNYPKLTKSPEKSLEYLACVQAIKSKCMYKEVSLFFSLLCFSVLTNEVTTLMRTSGDLGVSYSSMHASKLCFNNNDEQVYCAQSRNHSPGTLSSDKIVLHNETKQEYKN